MAVPASNIGLQRLRQDHDLAAAGALDDKAIRWRTHAFTGSEVPISITALANSAGCIQDVDGRSWGWGGDRSMSAKDHMNSQYMSLYSVSTPSPGVCEVQAIHKGNAASTPVATISRHYAHIEGGGNIRVQFNMTKVGGSSVKAYAEVLGSSSGYLQGTNDYLATFNAGASESRVITVPANRPFVSVMLQANVSGQANQNIGGTVTYTNLRITKQ